MQTMHIIDTLLSAADKEAALLELLKVPDNEKREACRKLASISTAASVAPLAAMLRDANLSHMARYGLETNPDPAVDKAFRDELAKPKDQRMAPRTLTGIIGSVGCRKDTEAVPLLAELLKDEDTGIVQAAGRALGKIGNPPAVEALTAAVAGASGYNLVSIAEGLFRAAEAAVAAEKADVATPIYATLRGLKDAPQQIRLGALRGAILANKKDGATLLVEGLRGDDEILLRASLRTAQEICCSDLTKTLSDELPKLSPVKQVLLIQTLGKRRDAAAIPALSAAAKSSEKEVREAAVRALAELGSKDAIPALKEGMKDPEEDVQKAAERGVGYLESL